MVLEARSIIMASWAVKKRVAALAIVYLLDGRAGVLVLGEPVGRVLDDEEGDGARVRLEGFESGGWAGVEVRAWICEGERAASCELLAGTGG